MTVTTIEDLERLTVGTVIMEEAARNEIHGAVFTRFHDGWVGFGESERYPDRMIELPVTVLVPGV